MKQLVESDGSLDWKYVERGYDAAKDGLTQAKDASWHYLHEMVPDTGDDMKITG